MDILCVSIKCGWQVIVDWGTHDMTGKVLFSLIEGNTGPYSFLSVDMSKSIYYTSYFLSWCLPVYNYLASWSLPSSQVGGSLCTPVDIKRTNHCVYNFPGSGQTNYTRVPAVTITKCFCWPSNHNYNSCKYFLTLFTKCSIFAQSWLLSDCKQLLRDP